MAQGDALARLAIPALLLVIGVALAWHAWPALGDASIDFPRDPYVAWQLCAGRHLYADVSYLYGPLPAYANAALFWITGPSLNALKAMNCVLLAAATFLLYDAVRRTSGRTAAVTCSAMFLVLFGLGDFAPLGNYNFIAPYTHAATYGFLLCLLSAWALVRLAIDGSRWFGVLGTCAAGLALLTKPEMGLAAMLVLDAWAALTRRAVPFVVLPAAAGVAVATVVVLALVTRTDMAATWTGSIRGYQLAADPMIRDAGAFKAWAGTDRYANRNAMKILEWSCVWCWWLLPPILIAMARPRRPWISAAVALACGTALWFACRQEVKWKDAFRGVPLLLIVVGATLFVRRTPLATARLILVALGLATAARMLLNFRVYHYGFFQAAAGVTVLAAAMIGWLPEYLTSLGRSGAALRWSSIAMAAVLSVVCIGFVGPARDGRTELLSGSGESIAGGAVTADLREAADAIRSRAGATDSLAVWPEGCSLNYLLRMPNPAHELGNPVGVAWAGGDAAFSDAFARTLPTWVLITSQDCAVFGAAKFGVDYARGARRVLDERYAPVWTHKRCSPSGYDLTLYRTRDGG